MNQSQVQPTEIYTFSRDIPVNTQITAGDLKKVTIPSSAVTIDFARSGSAIIGKYSDTKVFAGERVLTKHLVEKGNIDPFESMDLSKLRKISLPMSYIEGLGGNLKRADKVDLIYTAVGKKDASGNQTEFQYSKAFMQNLIVYSVTTEDGYKYTDKSQGTDNASNNKDISTGEDSGKMSTITLAVTLDQAEQISARQKAGTIRMVGRFDKSQDNDSTGYIIGDFNKISSGAGLAESNK